MRKTLVAVAAALAFGSLSAHAGDVQMYGLIDVGLSYVHSDADQPGVDSVDKFTMESLTISFSSAPASTSAPAGA